MIIDLIFQVYPLYKEGNRLTYLTYLGHLELSLLLSRIAMIIKFSFKLGVKH